MNARELRMTPEQFAAEQARQKAAKRARSLRVAPRKAASRTKKRNEKERDAAFYAEAKRKAAERATDGETAFLGPRCEYVIGLGIAKRCPAAADDPDHVIGGAYRKDCERLGAEGLECLCRGHHDLKHANAPSRRFWLDHAEEHALRYGYRGLLSLVARARAKYEAKRPARRRSPPTPTPDKETTR